MRSTIPEVLRLAAQTHGDHPALVTADGVLSHRALHTRVQEVAARLLEHGVVPGEHVVVWGPNSPQWAVAALAVTYAGGVLVPANSRYTGHEVADLVQRTRAGVVWVADGFLGRTQRADLLDAGPLPSVRALGDLAKLDLHPHGDTTPRADVTPAELEARADTVGPDDVADVLFTSGTTGRSKGAMSAHRQSLEAARTWAELGGVRQDDRYLVVNPFFHSFGYKIGILVGLLTGATLYPVATFDVGETLSLIERERITLFPGAPTLYQSLLTAPERDGRDLSSLRLAVTGAAMVPVVLIERMRAPEPEGLGIDQVVTAFGMTEAVVVTMCRLGDDAETVATTCGRAVPGMEVRIDGAGRPGEEGELLVRGGQVMLGYLDDAEATAAAVDDEGWLHTGDVGRLDEHGNLTITDRLKDMYISGGFNVYPAEVEQVLLRCPGVADVAVVGVPDERMGEIGRAFVVGTATEADVLAFAREHLANFKVPRHVTHLENLPRNLGGKVLKTDLRSL